MTNINLRFRIIRDFLLRTQKEFADLFGITQQSYFELERGKPTVRPAYIDKLVEEFQVDRLWLLTGEGHPFLGLTEQNIQIEMLNDEIRAIKQEMRLVITLLNELKSKPS